MTISKEWLQQTIEEMEYDKATFHGDVNEDHGNVLEAFKLALASLEAERGKVRRFDLDVSDMVEDLDGEYVLFEEVLPYLNQYADYTHPQPLTTSERAELENYRNAQQVVPGDIDARMKTAGMLSAAEIIAGQPIDAFVKHAGVVDMGSLLQWVEMRRAEFLRMQARYELCDKEKDDLYEWVVSHVAVFSELHVNIRAAMQPGAVKDGWVACSERMPENGERDIWLFNGEGVHHGYVWDDYEFVDWNEEYNSLPGVTHWMPMTLPAAPQQESE